jgi:hypothetical protein
MKGKAGPALLDSYSIERQPVGVAVVERANESLRQHFPMWESLGLLGRTLEERKQLYGELTAATPEGVARRKRFQAAVEVTAHEFTGLGIEMNQWYESTGIYLKDEASPRETIENPILHYKITTYPGSRLPHVWLNSRIPGKQFSTHDLAGHGVFSLFTGIGGEEWKVAARAVSANLGREITTHSIGWNQDAEDFYFDWARQRQIEEDGCILVRPDRFVAWRSQTMPESPEEKLLHVLKSVLDL